MRFPRLKLSLCGSINLVVENRWRCGGFHPDWILMEPLLGLRKFGVERPALMKRNSIRSFITSNKGALSQSSDSKLSRLYVTDPSELSTSSWLALWPRNCAFPRIGWDSTFH